MEITIEIAAIAIAVLSLLISGVMAGWTIYRDAVQKPKFRVSVSLKTIVQADRDPDGPHIFLQALNLGPIPNRIGLPFARYSLWNRYVAKKGAGAYINPDYANQGNTANAQRIEVGDTATFVFPWEKDCFLKERFGKIGVTDGYGNLHWAPRKQLKRTETDYRK